MDNDSEDDLFGSDSEEQKSTPKLESPKEEEEVQKTSATTIFNEEDDDEDLFGADDDDKDKPEVPEAEKTEEEKLAAILGTEKEEGKVVKSKSKLFIDPTERIPEEMEKMFAKLPQFLAIQKDAYDESTYDGQQEAQQKNFSGQTTDVIRWRYKKDDNGDIIQDAAGKPMMESNARLQKLKTGAFRIVIGASSFDVKTEALAKTYLYQILQSEPPIDRPALTEEEEAAGVTVNNQTNLVCSANLGGSSFLRITPSESNTRTSGLLKEQLHRTKRLGSNLMGAVNLKEIHERPEDTHDKLVREEEAKNRAIRRQKEMGVEGAAGTGSYNRIGMSADYLNADNEDMYDTTNLSELKKRPARGKKGKGKIKKERYEDRSDDDSEEDEDEDGEMDGFIEKDNKSGDDDDDEDDEDEDEDDEDDVQDEKDGSDADKVEKAPKEKKEKKEDDSAAAAVGGGKRTVIEDDDEEEGVVHAKKRARNVIDDDSD